MTSVDVLGLRPRLDRVVDRTLPQFEPAAVVDGGLLPTHQIGVEPCLACTPAGPAVEGDPLVRCDADLLPDGRDLRVGAHRVVHVAVMLHVVGVRATVAPDVTGDPASRADVVGAADLSDLPGPSSRPLLVGVAFGVAAIEDDRGVAGDSERAQGLLELLR